MAARFVFVTLSVLFLCYESQGACPNIISRASWNARAPRSVSYLSGPVKYAFIHHSVTADCFNTNDCAAKVRAFQNYHMDTHGWSDIGYSFVIGNNGDVFEGQGWDRIGAHTGGYNSVGLGFCLVGNFMNHASQPAQLSAVKSLIQCGVDSGKIISSYTLRGHRDMGQTLCPGDHLYNEIKTWPHY